MTTLKAELTAVTRELGATLPEDALTLLQRSTQRMIDNKLGDEAVTVGDTFPTFSLPNAVGDAVSSEDLLTYGPLVLSFYRGGWCPYCNLELRAYQQLLPDIRNLGADFLAISPQLPDESLTMAAKANLSFEVLTDTGNSLAEHLGLVFEVSPGIQDIYRSMGYDLERINGNTRWTLPIPATYVINSNSVIEFAFVNPDHSVRLEPSEVLSFLASR
jgi:peroxiredoxin